jgi:hypothetical protein
MIVRLRRFFLVCAQLGLEALCQPVQGNFLDMPFAKETFDAAYAIEATCHANKVRQPQGGTCIQRLTSVLLAEH